MTFFSGLEGGTGPCCVPGVPCTKIFSVMPQLILSGGPVLLEKVGVQSGEIDLSLASAFGMIAFNRSGIYKIIWHGEARSLFNIPWSLGFSLDNTILLGRVYGDSGSHSLFEKFEGSVVLSINAGQILRFINVSPYPVELIPESNDSQLLLPSFTLCLSLFELH